MKAEHEKRIACLLQALQGLVNAVKYGRPIKVPEDKKDIERALEQAEQAINWEEDGLCRIS